jgi:hypothetical protein
MNNRYVLRVGLAEDRPVGPDDSNSSREVEKFNDLRPGQILSVRKACDKFLESRGLKQMPFGAFVLRRRGIRNDSQAAGELK